MIDDEAIEDARKKMETFQTQRGLLTEDRAARLAELKAEIQRLESSSPV
jgi:hypothetical protein